MNMAIDELEKHENRETKFDDNGNFVVTGTPEITHSNIVISWENGILQRVMLPYLKYLLIPQRVPM